MGGEHDSRQHRGINAYDTALRPVKSLLKQNNNRMMCTWTELRDLITRIQGFGNRVNVSGGARVSCRACRLGLAGPALSKYITWLTRVNDQPSWVPDVNATWQDFSYVNTPLHPRSWVPLAGASQPNSLTEFRVVGTTRRCDSKLRQLLCMTRILAGPSYLLLTCASHIIFLVFFFLFPFLATGLITF